MLLARSLATAIFVLAGTLVQAQTPQDGGINYDTARTERRLPAKRADGPITLDGRLDEASWAGAPLADKFVQNDPREGEPATYDTEVRMLYDDRALYIGVFARDPEPGAIIVNELRKDFNTGTADGFQVVIDTFHDERNGYQFAINPGGAKWDSQMSNEGRDQNQNWDGIWDVGTRIGEDGWYAEIEIPFKTLKFGPDELQNWGVNFQRRLRRRNENSYWAPLRRIHQLSRVSMAGTYEGLQGLTPGANIRIKPYALANMNKLADVRLDKDYDAGFDVKYGVTSGLTWDFTVNTDFSQVEADEQQVNLTRFNLFFPEKRDFFLENSGVFQFGSGNTGGGGGGGGGGRQNASQDMIFFFSRQIGLSPAGDAIPLLAGTRLTGRVGDWSVGALNIQQREQGLSPSTNFTSLRARRDILANSDLGVMFLNKDPNGRDYNRAFGADANFRFFRDLTFNVAGAKQRDAELAAAGHRRRLVFEEQLRLSRRRARDARDVPDHRIALQRRDGLRAEGRRRQPRGVLRHALALQEILGLDARDLPALPDRELHQAQRRRPRVALHGLALAGDVPEQRVRRGRRQPERGGDRRPLRDQRAPRHLRRAGPLRIQGILRPRQQQRRGALLDEPALR